VGISYGWYRPGRRQHSYTSDTKNPAVWVATLNPVPYNLGKIDSVINTKSEMILRELN
jgi:hypothetical protein